MFAPLTKMRRHVWILLALFLVAFALRLAYWQRTASFGKYELSYDDDEYFQLGVLFARGEFFQDPYPLRYTRAPGFPLFLAPIFAAFGTSIEIALVFQIGISVLTVALMYVAARRAFGENAGVWAAGLLAVAPFYASTAGSWVLSETLFVFCVLLFLYVLTRWMQPLSYAQALGAGFILGYAALVRPMALYFLPLVALEFLYTQRARWKWAVARVALLTFGALVLILPYTARNAVTFQRWLLIDSTGGWNLWRDHRARNDDFENALAVISNPADRDRYAMQRGIQNILADPLDQLGIQGAQNFAGNFHLELDAYARGAGFLTDVNVDAPTLPLVAVNDIFFLGVVVLGMAGIFLTWRAAPKLFLAWLVYTLLLLALYHAFTRFRLHFVFVFIFFAGAALAQGLGFRKHLSARARVAWLMTTCLIFYFAYTPRLAPLLASEFYLWQANGRDIEIVQKAVAAFPDYLKARDELGDAYRRAGDFDKALAAYDSALQRNEYEVQARLGKIDTYRRLGEFENAAREIRAAGAAQGQADVPAPLFWSFDATPTRSLELGDSTSSFGYVLNLHAIEMDGAEPFRFTRARSFVKFPGVREEEPQTLVFYARAVPLPNKPLPSVTVRLNSKTVAEFQLSTEWMDYPIRLDNALRQQDTLIVEFRSPTFRPSDVLEHSTDARELGFKLGYVELR